MSHAYSTASYIQSAGNPPAVLPGWSIAIVAARRRKSLRPYQAVRHQALSWADPSGPAMPRSPRALPLGHECHTPSVGSGSDGDIHALPTLTGRHRTLRWREEQRMGSRPSHGRPSPEETTIAGQAAVRLGASAAPAAEPDSVSGWSPRPGLVAPVVRASSLADEGREPLG